MLAADKLQLQSALKQQAVSLKEKEFNLHHSNLMTVGTQSAVLAGLDITMFIEFTPEPDSEWGDNQHICRVLKFVYYTMITAAFCCNMRVVSQTTVLSVLGAGLALRGPDGSMMIATDTLYAERKLVFTTFGYGLALTLSSVLVAVWLMLKWEAALSCWFVAAYTCHVMYKNYKRVYIALEYDENDTVDFTDIFTGPANIQLKNVNNRKRRTSTSDKYNLNNNSTTSSRNNNNNYNNRNHINDKYYNHDYRSHSEDDSSIDGSTDIELQRQRLLTNRGTNKRNQSSSSYDRIQTV